MRRCRKSGGSYAASAAERATHCVQSVLRRGAADFVWLLGFRCRAARGTACAVHRPVVFAVSAFRTAVFSLMAHPARVHVQPRHY